MLLTFLGPVGCLVYKVGRVGEVMARVPTNCSVLCGKVSLGFMF